MEMYGRKRKSAAGLVIGIMIFVILFVASLAIGLLGLLSSDDGVMPNIAGYSVYTANMHIENIPEHAAVVVNGNVVPEAGNAVLFRTAGNSAEDMNVAYMVEATDVSIVIGGGELTELYDVPEGDVYGKVIAFVPVLGTLIGVAQSVYGGLLFVLLAFFMLLLIVMFCFKISDRKKRPTEEEIDAAIAEAHDEEAEAAETAEEERPSGLVFTDDIVPEKKAAQPAMLSAAASGNVEDSYVSLIINASEEEIDRVKAVIENGLKKKAVENWEVKRVDAQQPTLAIHCSWQDMAVVSLLISALRKVR